MPDVIDYNPQERTADDVPSGTYEVEFVGTIDKPPFTEGRFSKPGRPPEPRLGWHFKILSGHLAGKIIEQGTGTYPAPKSKLVYVLNLMLGGTLQPGQVNIAALKGRRYHLMWSRNPDSEKGLNHVAGLMPVSGSAPPPPQNGPAPPPPSGTAPPPPPPGAGHAPSPPPDPKCWFVLKGQASAVEMTVAEFRRQVDALIVRPEDAMWMPPDQSKPWAPVVGSWIVGNDPPPF